MTTVRVVLTYEDYAALPNDGERYEILATAVPPFDGLRLDPASLWVY